MPAVDLDEHRRLDDEAMAQQDPKRFPWTWNEHPDPRIQVCISAADARLIVKMRNDHVAMLDELRDLRSIVEEFERERAQIVSQRECVTCGGPASACFVDIDGLRICCAACAEQHAALPLPLRAAGNTTP